MQSKIEEVYNKLNELYTTGVFESDTLSAEEEEYLEWLTELCNTIGIEYS